MDRDVEGSKIESQKFFIKCIECNKINNYNDFWLKL